MNLNYKATCESGGFLVWNDWQPGRFINVNKPRRLAKQSAAGRQPLRYSSLSSINFASRVFFCTAMAENMLRQKAIA